MIKEEIFHEKDFKKSKLKRVQTVRPLSKVSNKSSGSHWKHSRTPGTDQDENEATEIIKLKS